MEEASSLLRNDKTPEFPEAVPTDWEFLRDEAETGETADDAPVVQQGMGAAAMRESLDADEISLRRYSEGNEAFGGMDGTDLVRVYLNQIGEYPLLNAKQEVELSKTIEAGLYAAYKLAQAEEAGETLPAQMAADLAKIAAAGERAKDSMLNSNLRLVVSVAKRYRTTPGMNFLDFVQEGNAGLIRAVEKFDYTKGFKFSTYAMWWIRQAITRARAENSRTIRVPVHQSEVLNTWRKTFDRLSSELNRDPTDEEVLTAKRAETAARLRAKTGQEPTEAQIDKGTSLTLSGIKWAKDYSRRSMENPLSLDVQLSADGTLTLLDVVADDAAVGTPEEVLYAQERREMARDLLNALAAEEDGERLASIVIARNEGMILEEVGDKFGISRERVRQLEKIGRKRLKALAENRGYINRRDS